MHVTKCLPTLLPFWHHPFRWVTPLLLLDVILPFRQVDEDWFPIHPFDDVTTSSGYVGYWTWEHCPALRGTMNLDNLGCFCTHFICNIYSKACKCTEIRTVEFDEIANRIDSGLVCGHIQFQLGFICWSTSC